MLQIASSLSEGKRKRGMIFFKMMGGILMAKDKILLKVIGRDKENVFVEIPNVKIKGRRPKFATLTKNIKLIKKNKSFFVVVRGLWLDF